MDEKLTIVDRVLFLMELDMFQAIDTEQVAQIAARTTEVQYEPGDTVYEEGQHAEGLFLLVEGEIELLKDGTRFGRLTRGAGFGLPAILGPDATFRATARAVAQSYVLLLSREAFFDAVAEYPEFAEAIIRALAGGVMDLSHRVEKLEAELGIERVVTHGQEAPTRTLSSHQVGGGAAQEGDDES